MSESDEFSGITQEQLEEMAAPFYRGLGRALARWQHVETGMFLLCHAIMDTNYKYSSAAFYLLKGGEMKLQLLNRLCEAHFDDGIIKNIWTPTLKDIKAALKFRNGLAHFEINYVTNRSILKEGDPPVVLTPHHMDIQESGKPMVKAAMLHEINHAAEMNLILARRLISMVQRYFSLERLHATHLPPRWLQYLEKGQTPRPKRPPPPGSSQG